MDTGNYMANQMDSLIENGLHQMDEFINDLDNRIEKFIKVDGSDIDLKKCVITNQEDYGNFTKKKFSYPLENKKEYHIERCFNFTQQIDDDRIVSFSSSNVVDDLTVRIKLCEKLQIVFEPVGNNYFNKENIFQDRICYVNRDVFLPGEKYKIFLFRKHN